MHGIKPSISTNGSLLTEKLIIELYNAGVEYIHLSIDGATPETHNELRGVPNAFEVLMNKMELLKNSKIKVGASFMVTEKSINEIDEVLEIAKNKNLSVISFYLVAELGRGAINFKESKVELANKLYEKINKIDNTKFPNLKIEVFRANQRNIQCNEKLINESILKNEPNTINKLKSENKLNIEDKETKEDYILQECKGYNFFNITYDAKLGACPWIMKSKQAFSVGNLLNEDFVLLKNNCKNKMKELINNRKNNIKFCKSCSKNNECGKGCLALQINDNEKLNRNG